MQTPIIIGRNVRRSQAMCKIINWRMNNELAGMLYTKNLQKWGFFLLWCGAQIAKKDPNRVSALRLLVC